MGVRRDHGHVRAAAPARVSFEEFKQAWIAGPDHFGQPVAVTYGRRLDHDREVVSHALLDTTVEQLADVLSQMSVVHGESERHDRIERVLEGTVIKRLYEISSRRNSADNRGPFTERGGEVH
jgi:hypothetical protein